MHKGKMSMELKYTNHDFSGEPVVEKLFCEYDGLSIDGYGNASPDSILDYGKISSSSISSVVVDMEKGASDTSKEVGELAGHYDKEVVVELVDDIDDDEDDDDDEYRDRVLKKLVCRLWEMVN